MRRFVVLDGGLLNANTPTVTEIRTMKKTTFSSWSEQEREEVVDMIRWGWSDDEILQMVPHIERGSVTAFRAHVTRGTYGYEHRNTRHRKSSS